MNATMSSAQLATAAEHLTAAKMFSLASCVMLFYDIAITFGDEVERIWKQRFTGATVLWFLNRYLSPLGYIVIIVSFNDPSWSKATCERYVLYPEVLKVFTATAVGLIFILRLYSIYAKSNAILYGFGTLLVMELGIKIWAFTDGVMLQLPPGFVGCILTGRSSPGDRIIYTWVAELVFDSCVFFATLYRTIQLYRRTIFGEALSLITVIMRDGIMYFAAIFVSNLVTVLIFIFATNDLKVINASFSTLITSLMVSRLMLNLRGEALRRGPVISSNSTSAAGHSLQLTSTDYSKHAASRGETITGWSAFTSSMVGNLGAPVITFEGDNSSYYDFNDEDDDVLDPTLPPSSSANRPGAPYSPPLTHDPHSYPPTSPRSADLLYRSYDRTSDETETNLLSKSDTTHFSPRTGDFPVHGDYGAHHIQRAIHHKASAESSSSFTALPTRPRGVMRSFRRPRTAESATSGREDGWSNRDRQRDLAETRSLPAPLIVQVTEEVVVDEEDVGAAALQSSRSASAMQQLGRRPWLAPASWRLSREQEREAGRRGSAEG